MAALYAQKIFHGMVNTVTDDLTAGCSCLSGSEWRRLRSNLTTLFMEQNKINVDAWAYDSGGALTKCTDLSTEVTRACYSQMGCCPRIAGGNSQWST